MPVSPATLSRQCAPRTVIHLEAHRPVLMVRDEAPPTVESIQRGERLLAACNTDACNQGRAPCPTPDACRLRMRDDGKPRMPREQAVGEAMGNAIGWFVLGLLALMLAVAVFGQPGTVAWLRSFFS